MRVVNLLLALAVLAPVAACTSSGESAARRPATAATRGGPAPTPMASQPHLPTGPLAPQACGRATPTADGNVRPVFCRDGHPSAAADRFYRDELHATILRLPRHATTVAIERAICVDRRAHITGGEEEWAVLIAAVEQGWRRGAHPDSLVVSARC